MPRLKGGVMEDSAEGSASGDAIAGEFAADGGACLPDTSCDIRIRCLERRCVRRSGPEGATTQIIEVGWGGSRGATKGSDVGRRANWVLGRLHAGSARRARGEETEGWEGCLGVRERDRDRYRVAGSTGRPEDEVSVKVGSGLFSNVCTDSIVVDGAAEELACLERLIPLPIGVPSLLGVVIT